VSPVRYELGFYIPEDGILHSHHYETLKSYITKILFSILFYTSFPHLGLFFYVPLYTVNSPIHIYYHSVVLFSTVGPYIAAVL
jgi:hypothetical protein